MPQSAANKELIRILADNPDALLKAAEKAASTLFEAQIQLQIVAEALKMAFENEKAKASPSSEKLQQLDNVVVFLRSHKS